MRMKYTKEEINLKLAPRGISMIGEFKTMNTKTFFKCKSDHSEWLTTPNSVLNTGTGCPECSNHKPLLKEEINLKLASRGISMIGEFTTTKIKTLFECRYNHQWEAIPNNVINRGRGCPCCNAGGFRVTKPGTFYILDFGNFIKYGITNNPESRFTSHKRNGQYKLILTKSFEDGLIAQKLERDIKNIFGGKFATKEECPDGWTETLNISILSDLIGMIESYDSVNLN